MVGRVRRQVWGTEAQAGQLKYEAVEGAKVFTIAYGEDADADLMLRIANRTNGKTFTGDPASIEAIYNAISAEQ
mgnify:CR=1 FL=1